jgi:hypothetical protein
MKVSAMRRNGSSLLCVLVFLSFTAEIGTGALAAKPVD